MGSLCVDDEVVIAVRAVLIAVLELRSILSEALLALFASEYHLESLKKVVGLLLVVALRAIEPFAACIPAD